MHEAFDVPDGDGGHVGMRRDGDELVCVLTLPDRGPHPVRLPDGPRDRFPLTAVAAVFVPTDVRPTAIEVAEQTLLCRGDGPAARAYRELAGPLASASHRRVSVVVRMAPQRFPEAVARRGGGAVGVLRAALWCLRRVRALLAAAGVDAHPLTAAELTAAGDVGPVRGRVTDRGVDGAAPPLGGDGQIVGADDDGRAVAVAVAGPRIARADLVGDLALARLTVLRSAAIGVRVHVDSGRPEAWAPLVRAIADPVLMSAGARLPASAQMLVHDHPAGAAPAVPGVTVLAVRPVGVDPVPDRSACTLVQDGDRPDRVRLRCARSAPVAVRSVSTPAERALIG